MLSCAVHLGGSRAKGAGLRYMADDRVPTTELRTFGCVSVHVSLQQVAANESAGAVGVLAVEDLLRLVIELMTVPVRRS